MNLFVLGLGYSATLCARRMRDAGHDVSGTVRSVEKAKALRAQGIGALAFDRSGDVAAIAGPLRRAEALLVSLPPAGGGDDLPLRLTQAIANAANLRWIGYLSTIGVYGDHGGAWIDETTPCTPISARSRARLAAERQWTKLGAATGRPVVLLRLPGIYGPGRNALTSLRNGTARRIVKPGQVFNRVHVEDIAAGISLSLAADGASAVYNLTDDEPAPPQDVIAYAAGLLGIAPPPELPFDEADLSPMAASFYGENKRVRNSLAKERLGFHPVYPTYREGLWALLASGE